MIIGDVVQNADFGVGDNRDIGIVLKIDSYRQYHYEPLERIAEVLWNDGKMGWINLDRLVILHTNKSD
jgi:hypothetical protein